MTQQYYLSVSPRQDNGLRPERWPEEEKWISLVRAAPSGRNFSTPPPASMSSSDDSAVNRRHHPHLTLDNFDSDDVPQDCPFVLTSPRSLKACKIRGVKPVDLLPCSLQEIRGHVTSEGDLSFESLAVLRRVEEERRSNLEACRELRRRLIEEEQEEESRDEECAPLRPVVAGEGAEDAWKDSTEFKANLGRRQFLEEWLKSREDEDQKEKCSWLNHDAEEKEKLSVDDFGRGRDSASPYFCGDRPEAEQSFGNYSRKAKLARESSLLSIDDRVATPREEELRSSSSKKSHEEEEKMGRNRKHQQHPLSSSSRDQTGLLSGNKERSIQKKEARKMGSTTSSSIRPKSSSSAVAATAGKKHKKRLDEAGSTSTEAATFPDGRHKSGANISLDLSCQDRRILTCLAHKHALVHSQELAAHVRQLLWQEEVDAERQRALSRERRRRETVRAKRAGEAEENRLKLESAKESFLRSQEQLRKIINERDERRLQMRNRETQQRLGDRSSSNKRRLAAEEAIADLLSKDARYRQELGEFSRRRVEEAEQRRRSRRDQYQERMAIMNAKERERHRDRMTLIKRAERQQMRDERRKHQEREAAQHQGDERLQEQVEKLRQLRERRFEQARALRQELESKLDEWRRQVLAVQTESIRRAEERAEAELSRRRQRVTSLNRERELSHGRRWRTAQSERRRAESVGRVALRQKAARADCFADKRKQEVQEARDHARKVAAARQEMRSDSFDQKVHWVDVETWITSRKF